MARVEYWETENNSSAFCVVDCGRDKNIEITFV